MPKAKTYDQGDTVRLAVKFQDYNFTDADPTAVSLIVQDADGTTTTYTYAGAQITKDSVGDYHMDLSLTAGDPGWWYYRWVGTGAVEAVEEGQFFVRKAVNA